MHPFKLVRAGLVVVALVSAAALAGMAPANADHGIYTTASVTIRGSGSLSGVAYGTVPSGVSPTYRCWAQGNSVGSVDVWFLVSYQGHTGFIPSYYDNSHYASDSDITWKYGIPKCGLSGAGIHTTATVTMRGSGSTTGYSQGSVPYGVSPTYRCWAQGNSIGGVDVWFLVSYQGHTGFVPSYYDNSHYASDSDITWKYGIPKCGSTSTSASNSGTGNYSNSALSSKALTYLETYQGQCRTFVNKVVSIVSGGSQNTSTSLYGGDYFASLAHYGPRITSVGNLRTGDIVQIGRYSTSAGLHTFIIVSHISGSSFYVVDSNHHYDGIVNKYARTVTLSDSERAYRLGKV